MSLPIPSLGKFQRALATIGVSYLLYIVALFAIFLGVILGYVLIAFISNWIGVDWTVQVGIKLPDLFAWATAYVLFGMFFPLAVIILIASIATNVVIFLLFQVINIVFDLVGSIKFEGASIFNFQRLVFGSADFFDTYSWIVSFFQIVDSMRDLFVSLT